ncbi:MAG TPA: hypothetical protein VG841_15595 [Caulobacterales bacterium]|nr:hypothetical protein [Caulobacterales bacterium]
MRDPKAFSENSTRALTIIFFSEMFSSFHLVGEAIHGEESCEEGREESREASEEGEEEVVFFPFDYSERRRVYARRRFVLEGRIAPACARTPPSVANTAQRCAPSASIAGDHCISRTRHAGRECDERAWRRLGFAGIR